MTTAVTGTTPTSSSSTSTTASSDTTLDKNAFLQLLVTEMQNQDPLNPTDDTSFIAQLAQFSSLEQMQQVSTNTDASQALSMVGQQIDYTDPSDATQTLTGTVSGVSFSGGVPSLIVGTNTVDLSDVVDVHPTSSAPTTGTSTSGT